MRWATKPRREDAYLINEPLDLHADDPEFGYRLLGDDPHAAGQQASDNRLQRLGHVQQVASVHSRNRDTGRKPGPPAHEDLLAVTEAKGRLTHDFTATAPDTVWLTDITEHPTAQGKLYLCAVKDVCSNRIVGYSIDSRMNSSLAVSALRNAIAQRHPETTIVHSDRGSQFRSRKYVQALKRAGLRGLDGPSRGLR